MGSLFAVTSEAPNRFPNAAEPSRPPYRDILALGERTLTAVERAQIRFVRRTFERPWMSDLAAAHQRTLGASWVQFTTYNLTEVYGLDRFPRLAPNDSVILVSNHRSFFDMYVLSALLIKRLHMKKRLVFPVRSKFFYDSPAGLLVNGVMSAFAMYPPIFRERSRAALNIASLDETIRLLGRGGVFLGMHPEGKRNQGDPYEFLPAQRGVGRILHECPNAKVVPVFINGLGNGFIQQIRDNFNGRGERVIAVFGEPIDFGAYLKRPSSPKLHKELSDISMEHVRRLSQEERTYRSMPRTDSRF
jgi:1-acyl-sn-glycerol-3-phosphate acyltransferase